MAGRASSDEARAMDRVSSKGFRTSEHHLARSGRRSALLGWIDGLRKTIDAGSYKIRFTPRRPTSNWSAVNIRRMNELIPERRVRPAGMNAFQKRTPDKSGVYSYENRKSATLSRKAARLFRADRAAWDFFQRQSPSYRQNAIWWVASAKRAETQQNRLGKLIAASKSGGRL